MARYFLHLRDHTAEVLDPEGIEFSNEEGIPNYVLECVRDLIRGDVRKGVIDFRFRIDAEDANGVIVHTLPFSEAVTLIPNFAA